MKSVHVLAAFVALCVVFSALVAFESYATGLERLYIHALAPLRPPINIMGSALQKVACNQPDLLLVYGASEQLGQSDEFQATQFFKNYPTGFAPYEVARDYSTAIIYAEATAAIGSDLQGKEVVISFTPSQFTEKLQADHYAGLFSRLHANELAFSSALSYETKKAAARRMLQYPQTLQADPVLRFALERLAEDTLLSHALYYLSFPLGKVQTAILELQDHFETVSYIWSLSGVIPDVPRQPTTIDWNAQIEKARLEQIPHSNNNPYGFDNRYWYKYGASFKPRAVPQGDSDFRRSIDSSAEWGDLELLLKILKELGARPLLLGRAVNAPYYHATGVSDVALMEYYNKLDGLAKQYAVPVVDFRNLQADTYFGVDPAPHTSREGWVYVDQALDAFYHSAAH